MLFEQVESMMEEKKLEMMVRRRASQAKNILNQFGKEKEIRENRKKMRSQILNAEDKDESIVKRVSVEAIDFDWIFLGENAESFLKLLTQQNQGRLFIQNSIRIFIELLWQKYQQAIVMKIFVPYLTYMFLFVYLTSSKAGDYLDYMDSHEEESTFDKILTLVLTLACVLLWFFFF